MSYIGLSDSGLAKSFLILSVCLMFVFSVSAEQQGSNSKGLFDTASDYLQKLLPTVFDSSSASDDDLLSYRSGFGSEDSIILSSTDSPGYFSIKQIYSSSIAEPGGSVDVVYEVKNFDGEEASKRVKVKLEGEESMKEVSLEANQSKRITHEVSAPDQRGTFDLTIFTENDRVTDNVEVRGFQEFDVLISDTEGYREGENVTISFEIENEGRREDRRSYHIKSSATDTDIVGEVGLEPGEKVKKNASLEVEPGYFGRQNVTVKTPKDSSTRPVVIKQDLVGNIDHFIKPFEVNGDPENQINMLVHGDRIDSNYLEKFHLKYILNEFYDGTGVLKEYRDRINWYYLDVDDREERDQRICGDGIRGPNVDQGCSFIEDNLKLFESSDTIDGGRVVRNVLSSRDFRSYAFRSTGSRFGSVQYTSISGSGHGMFVYGKGTFIHELGHSMFGMDDEYKGAGVRGPERTYIFPDRGLDTHRNAWETLSSCRNEMEDKRNEGVYSNISAVDCKCHKGEDDSCEDPVRIKTDQGLSFMESSSTLRMYENHEERIITLFENHEEYK